MPHSLSFYILNKVLKDPLLFDQIINLFFSETIPDQLPIPFKPLFFDKIRVMDPNGLYKSLGAMTVQG